MGQEIERARALLAELSRSGLLPADRASVAYEDWVARAGADTPFSRFLVLERRVDPEALRAALRVQAIQGMPYPDRWPAERFEDLLMGQLGIEAGLLGTKMLQTVRKVQDKKVAEGKLRRLAELLPRAGFDPRALGVLQGHLAERVVICPGCLARYPRKEPGRLELECARCALPIAVDACRPPELDQLPEEQKRQLLASSESSVFETVSVSVRERGARGHGGAQGARGVFALLLVAAAAVVAAALTVAAGRARPTAPRPPAPPRPRPALPDPGDAPAAAGLTLVEARRLERARVAEGRWEEALAAWDQLAPADAEQVEEQRRRRAELGPVVAASKQVASAIERARARPDDVALEEELGRAIAQAPALGAASPPWSEAARLLEERRAARREARVAEGRVRLDEALRAEGAGVAWAARVEHARRGPIMAVPVGGRSLDGVLVERLDDAGFALALPDGSRLEAGWTEAPALGLRVLRAATRPGEPGDALALLRQALLARDPLAAEEAREALGPAGAALDLAGALAGAPGPAAWERAGAGWRLALPTGWVAPGLALAEGTRARSDGRDLVLEGAGKVRLDGPELPLVPAGGAGGGGSARVRVGVVGPGAGTTTVGVVLVGQRLRRVYVARLGPGGWRFELDAGAGANVLREGPLGAPAQRVGFDLAPRGLTLWIDDVERATAPLTGQVEGLHAFVASDAGPLAVRSLEVEGDLDPGARADLEARYLARIDRALARAAERDDRRLAARAPSLEPRLDPLARSLAGPAALDLVARARQAWAEDRGEEAWRLLDEAAAAAPASPLPGLVRGGLALLEGDPARALAALAPLRAQGEVLPEAHALAALALARAGRTDAARAAAKRALDAAPDLAAAHAAVARCDWLERDLAGPGGDLPVGASLARALAPDDPLAVAEVRALERARALEARCGLRVAGAAHALASDLDEAAARQALEVLDGLVARLDRATRARGAPPVRVYLLSEAAHEAWWGGDELAWSPALAALVVRQGALPPPPPRRAGAAPDTPVPWALAHAVAASYVARRHGAPPAWLEHGLVTWLAAPLTGRQPPGVELAVRRAAWTADDWRRLFGLGRGALEANAGAAARAWGLVLVAQRQAPTQRLLADLLAAVERGEPAPWPADAPLDLGTLDRQITELVGR